MTQKEERKKLLIISHDKIGTKMAGPGIRYHYMAEYLSSDFDVCIGFFDPKSLPSDDFKRSYSVRSVDAFSFEDDFADFDYILALWLSDSMMNYCNVNDKVVIFDIYAPVPVENLAVKLFASTKIPKHEDGDYNASLIMYRKFLENGDAFLYSNDRQRDFWMGYIFGALQIIPSLYNRRPMYDRFIEAPMGIDTYQKLSHSKKVLRGVIPGITTKDHILLWTGGIWDWFDAITPIQAVKILQDKGKTNVKLVFLGTQHPNDNIPEMSEVSKARRKAEELGLINSQVFFIDGWVEYSDRINYLLESDVAIYSHKPSIETEFSHRTRVLDHFLASLPTIGTRGDYLGEIIENNNMGVIVEPTNPEEFAKAITTTMDSKKQTSFKNNINEHRESFGWVSTLEPLHQYLLSYPTKIERLPSRHTPLKRKSVEKIKKSIPKPVKIVLKKALGLIRGKL